MDKKNYHDFLNFFSISILITILTQTDMLYSYKCILCEFETFSKRKPIRPFPKSCNMSLQNRQMAKYIYIYILYVYVSNQIQQNKMQTEHVSESERYNILLCVCVRSAAHGQSKRSANVPLTGKPNPAQITRSH